MNDNKEFIESATIAQEMQNILNKKLAGNDMEYCFKFGSSTLSLLLAGFIDALFKEEEAKTRSDFVDELIRMTKSFLYLKYKGKQNNPGEKH